MTIPIRMISQPRKINQSTLSDFNKPNAAAEPNQKNKPENVPDFLLIDSFRINLATKMTTWKIAKMRQNWNATL